MKKKYLKKPVSKEDISKAVLSLIMDLHKFKIQHEVHPRFKVKYYLRSIQLSLKAWKLYAELQGYVIENLYSTILEKDNLDLKEHLQKLYVSYNELLLKEREE